MSFDHGSLTGRVAESIGTVGLRNTATKNKLTDTVVPLWELQSTADTVPSAESFNFTNPGAESVIGDDERVRVLSEHFLPGGKYRSIVKLFLRYENQPASAKWPVATGWLIRPDLLVTAGHCAFDWGHNMGRLVQVKCYIGYNGHESIHDSRAQVQFRSGKRIATTLEWMTAKGNRNFDVGFIQVDKPFTGTIPFKFADTPLSGTSSIGVVGYPGDLKDEKTKEPGAHMYEMFLPTNFNLAESQWRMLEYHIDTFGGNSGSPVVRESDLVALGVHVYGGTPNSASVIGMYGNPFLDYVAAFDMHAHKISLPGAASTPGVQYLTVPTSKTPDTVKGNVDLSKSAYGVFNAKEGFTNESRSFTTQTGSNQSGSSQQSFSQNGFRPSNGHDVHTNGNGHSDTTNGNGHHFNGGHHSAGNGRQNGSVAHHKSNGNGFSHNNGFNSSGFQVAERSKGGRRSIPFSAMDEEGFFEYLKQGIKVGGPILDNVLGTALPFVLGPLGGPISSLASIAISAAGKLAESSLTESGGLEHVIFEGATERAILAEAAFQAMIQMDNHTLAEEGFFTDMWSVVKKIAPVVKQIAPKVLDVVAQPALQIALQSLGTAQKGGAEGLYETKRHRNVFTAPRSSHNLPDSGAEAFLSRFEAAAAQGEEGFFTDVFNVAKKAIEVAGPILSEVAKQGLPILQGALTEADFEDDKSSAVMGIEGLHERAILAEAALQAALNASQSVLEEEGFFGFLAEAVKKIAPVVIRAAPGVIKAVSPVVSSLLGGKTESFGGNQGNGLRPLSLGTNGKSAGLGHNKDLWNQLQNHHTLGKAGEEFFTLDLGFARLEV